MGYRSDVKIKMARDAYKILKSECLSSEFDYVREMVEDPDMFEDFGDYITITWRSRKWYPYYEDVMAVNRAIDILDSMINENEDLLEKYYYKMIRLGEDNATYECTNDYDDIYVDDFYIMIDFSL